MAMDLADAQPVEPAAKAADFGQAFDAAQRLDERELDDVVGVRVGTQQSKHDTGDVAGVPAKQLRECRLVAGGAEPHQVLVGEVGPLDALSCDHRLLLGLSAPESAKLAHGGVSAN